MVCVGLDLRKQMPVKWRAGDMLASQQLFKAALKIFQRQNLSKFENFEILKLDICKTRFLMGETLTTLTSLRTPLRRSRELLGLYLFLMQNRM